MIRGQHVDLTILGAMEFLKTEISPTGKFQENGKGMGGAMDLASAENIIVAMMHVNKAGQSRFLNSVAYH
jgi:3-oxoacid CoA-transferase subunit B